MKVLVPLVTFTLYASPSTPAQVMPSGRVAFPPARISIPLTETVLLAALGITIVPFVPAGAVIRILKFKPVSSHAATIVPHGVGTRPFAKVKLTVLGAKDHVEYPGVAGETPST